MCDTRAKPLGLDEHRDQVSHFLEADPRAQVPQGLLKAQSSSQFKREVMEFFAQLIVDRLHLINDPTDARIQV